MNDIKTKWTLFIRSDNMLFSIRYNDIWNVDYCNGLFIG